MLDELLLLLNLGQPKPIDEQGLSRLFRFFAFVLLVQQICQFDWLFVVPAFVLAAAFLLVALHLVDGGVTLPASPLGI